MDFSTIPALAPPPGVKSNFVNPPSNVELTIAIGFTTLALAAFFLLARLYSNIRFTRSVGYDDCP